MKVVWTRRAVSDLLSIGDFIARDSPSRAHDFINKLRNRVKQAAKHPESGRVVPEIQDPSIRELIDRPYRIVYKLMKKKIAILQVFEGHRLLRK